MTAPIGVLIVDDQPMVRAGLRMILELEPDIDILGEAANGREAVASAVTPKNWRRFRLGRAGIMLFLLI